MDVCLLLLHTKITENTSASHSTLSINTVKNIYTQEKKIKIKNVNENLLAKYKPPSPTEIKIL